MAVFMFRNAVRPLSRALARDSPTRHFHHIATEFIALDATGRPVSEKVPVVIGNPGQAYVLISPSVGEAFRDASSTASTRDRCKLTFFHDTKHFGLTPSSYPRLHVPAQFPRQSDSNTSPATILLSGKMYEIVLDGTEDAEFAEHSSASGEYLKPVLDQLETM
ncbi:hypothetical protein DTO013E5_1201 [Penicillium roqueforti]|uniref:Genomic scaffold, ProqFM164S01 n=1 Tax=Penicillium roqueforti (strain FM164) TaxID=1365484 RepID=W6PZ53_PENRF|nr:uncharacterized protein LCP9604111_2361 [Penicillium roqueforti]CDM29011.1 unnamed protein product [Penicillium roqueforti FM164]KAF9252365.1 hypothetical protein LCP9604111_2361 [Penicillium roqueforti]KAI1837635.1 hypothetical protein CBS147337_1918 [Penicillium roqueforti]KAI2682493.1 hypothetical protein LCP963914a_6381 [Penicillium roqueforti]KAI2682823.1 hypothetical protein CBS147355_1963 [Penicillium roqueforti]